MLLRQKDNHKKAIKSLLGKFNFFTKVISSGMKFVKRNHDATILNVYFSEAEWSSKLLIDLYTDSTGAQYQSE